MRVVSGLTCVDDTMCAGTGAVTVRLLRLQRRLGECDENPVHSVSVEAPPVGSPLTARRRPDHAGFAKAASGAFGGVRLPMVAGPLIWRTA